jgi:tetratricopeptide (TPR) repeat protein
MTLDETLQSAIQAAKAGQRERARQLFIQVLKQDQRNLVAWVWLSEVAEDLPHRIGAIERAMVMKPDDPLLQGRLEALRSQLAAQMAAPQPVPVQPGAPMVAATEQQAPEQPSPAQPAPASPSPLPTRLQKDEAVAKITLAHELEKGGLKLEAVKRLEEAVVIDPTDETAWLLLADRYTDLDERVRALEKAAEINPSNAETARRLAGMRQAANDPFKRARYLEDNGEFEAAISVYTSIVVHSRSAAERVASTRRIEDIRLRQEADKIQPVNPNLNLTRLTLGPVFLFLIMVFVQSGLSVLHTPFLEYIGIVSVLAGSLMVAITGMRPAHPRWVALFGLPGAGDEPEMRQGVRLLGFALLLAPYAMFLIDAGQRLGVLRSSMLGQ